MDLLVHPRADSLPLFTKGREVQIMLIMKSIHSNRNGGFFLPDWFQFASLYVYMGGGGGGG